MLLVPNILIRLLQLLKPKNPLIHHPRNGTHLNRPHHLPKLRPTPHQQSPHRTTRRQRLQHPRLAIGLGPTHKPNHTDHALAPYRLQALAHRVRPPDLHHVVHPPPARDLLRRLPPVRVLAVVDDVRRAEGFELGFLGLGAGGGDDAGTRGAGELDCGAGDAAAALDGGGRFCLVFWRGGGGGGSWDEGGLGGQKGG